MAVEALLAGGLQVDLYDAMPSVGRKFLLAGKGGLNLTHSEPSEVFVRRYRVGGTREALAEAPAVEMAGWMSALDAESVRTWAHGLGIETFVGSSGKVFPAEMKAAPLLRAWLHRLRAQGLKLHMRHRWSGTFREVVPQAGEGGRRVEFETPSGRVTAQADVVVLALGGGSWARLGSDGAWTDWLHTAGVPVAPLRPSNCGFEVGWSEVLRTRHAGAPLKNVALSFFTPSGEIFHRLGEAVLSEHGLEGALVYAASADLRALIDRDGQADVTLDLLPSRTEVQVAQALAKGRGSRSWTNHLKEQTGLSGVKAGLVREGLDAAEWMRCQSCPEDLARRLKALPLRLRAPRPLDEAISSAGGVMFDGLDAALMLKAAPGVFCAGEMVDWEAPTGGYLLTACLASGRVAGQGALAWLQSPR